MRTVPSGSLPARRCGILGECTATRFSTQFKARRRHVAVHAAQLDSDTMQVMREKVQKTLGSLKRTLSIKEAQNAAFPPQAKENLDRISAWCKTEEGRRQLSLLIQDPELADTVRTARRTGLEILFEQPNSERLKAKIFRMLQEHCFPNLPTVKCDTILDAARHDKPDKVREFLEAGDNPNCVDSENRTPLHLSAWCEGALVIEILLEYDVNVNAKDANGDTPLHTAARRGSILAAMQLLSAGADGAIRNKQGQTPAAVARQNPQNLTLKDEELLFILDHVASG